MEKNEFLERLKSRIIEGRTNKSIGDWVCENTTFGNGKHFSFTRHKFQKDI